MAAQFDIPILYTVFNRIESVRRTFSEIKKIKPKQLFIGADGPRDLEERKKTNAVRKYILDNIDWECKVKTLFFNKNLGANIATFRAIDWFFKNIKKGIILEDDDLPNRSFFAFCKKLLFKYEREPKVMSICGFTQLRNINIKESYYFSKTFGVWGWATWRDRWQKTNLLLSDYERIKKNGGLSKIIQNPIERIITKRRLDYNLIGKVKGWDFAFLFLHLKNKGICIRPKHNLIENIGFSKEATVTSNNFIDTKFLCIKTSELKFPLIHPQKIEINERLSGMEFRSELKRSLFKRLLVFLHIIKYNYKY